MAGCHTPAVYRLIELTQTSRDSWLSRSLKAAKLALEHRRKAGSGLSDSSGADFGGHRVIYENYQRNHVILPGREDALAAFLRQDYNGMQHKLKHAVSSSSEDALTWSCFDLLASMPHLDKVRALDEILEDAFNGNSPLSFKARVIADADIAVCVGRKYTGPSTAESTEVDASLEAPGVLVFFEAKLYSAVSPAAPPEKPHDQIARKLRVGLDAAGERDFFFVFLDVAPVEKMYEHRPKQEVAEKPSGGYRDKWRSAWLFQYYKVGRNGSLAPLTSVLEGINHPPVDIVSARMGWLTWADLFKATMRAVILAKP